MLTSIWPLMEWSPLSKPWTCKNHVDHSQTSWLVNQVTLVVMRLKNKSTDLPLEFLSHKLCHPTHSMLSQQTWTRVDARQKRFRRLLISMSCDCPSPTWSLNLTIIKFFRLSTQSRVPKIVTIASLRTMVTFLLPSNTATCVQVSVRLSLSRNLP